jgi:catechol 2,3-dioxygenase-like lactoylglutathione lyase family enzyme
MSEVYVEHVNLVVRDPARTAGLMTLLFGWVVRWEGAAHHGAPSVHVGGERSYLALTTEFGPETPDAAFAKGRPLNHVGIVVDDLDLVEERVAAANLHAFNHCENARSRRFSFFDPDGIEFEVVSYQMAGAAAPGVDRSPETRALEVMS